MSETTPTAGRDCARHEKEIDELMVGTLAGPRLARLREHAAVCDACRQRYDRAALAARLLCGGPEALDRPAAPELDRVRERLLGRARLTPDPGWRRVGLRIGLALAGAAAAVVLVAPLALRDTAPPTTPPGLQARGGAATAARDQGPRVGVRALCIRQAAGAKPALHEMPPNGTGECSVDGALSFAYTNRSGLGQLFLFGVDERYAVHWYLPRAPAERSARVERDVVDEPLPRTVRLAVHHRPGALRVFALFSEGPLSGAQVQGAVDGLRARRAPLAELTRLPIAGTEQRSLLLRLLPAAPAETVPPLKLDGPGPQKPREN